MAATTKKTIEAELKAALAELHETPNDRNARASVEHATAMVRVWRLRFLLANFAYDTALADSDASAEVRSRNAMRDASMQGDAWEKAKSKALADLVNDILLAEQTHNDEQDALAARAKAMR